MERFEATVPPTYFRNAKAVIVVYAINDQESINNIIHWSQSLAPQWLGDMSQKLIQALVANKIDLPEEERVVTKKKGSETAENCDIDKEIFWGVSKKWRGSKWDVCCSCIDDQTARREQGNSYNLTPQTSGEKALQ